MAEWKTLEFKEQVLEPAGKGCVVWLTLNRPGKANAFDQNMLTELNECFAGLRNLASCRALIIRGAGRHFCAGADLSWMKASATLTEGENLKEARLMAEMFSLLYRLPLPTIAMVRGAAYGGGMGLAACCDLVIAEEQSRFCLSEVRLGILPAVILPYLRVKMTPGGLIRYSMTGLPFSGKEALEAGLVTICCPKAELSATLRKELDGLLNAGPQALARLKALQQSISSSPPGCHHLASRAIAEARSGPEAQAGFQAFFCKKPPPWQARSASFPEEF